MGLGVLAAVALALVWLFRPGPQTTGAQGVSTTAHADRLQGRARHAQPMDLPVVPGRHDRIHRDFFRLCPDTGAAVKAGEGEAGSRVGPPVVPSRPQGDGEPFTLRAIIVAAQPKALINDVIVSVGEKVKAEGREDGEFEVTDIDDQSVSLARGGQVIVLRLKPQTDGESGGAGSVQ